MLIDILERMGFRRSDRDNSWFKDYGNNVILKVSSPGPNELEIELNMPIPTGVDSSQLNSPEDVIRLLINLPISRDLLRSLSDALMDMMRLRMIISMSN